MCSSFVDSEGNVKKERLEIEDVLEKRVKRKEVAVRAPAEFFKCEGPSGLEFGKF